MDREWAPEIEKHIRDGKLELALSCLAKVSSKLKRREDRVQLANFYRRLSRPEESLRTLIGVVRPPVRRAIRATVSEKAEYAAALADVGASKEAISLLAGIHGENHAPSLLFEAFAHMGRWEYSEASECLEKYIAHRDITEYQRQVASINLIHALKFVGRVDEASAVAQLAVKKAAAGESRLLEAAALEAQAEVELETGHFDSARDLLKKSESLLPDSGFVMRFIVGKWMAVADFRKDGDAERAVQQLSAIGSAAIERGFWEIVRDCDFQRAVIARDPDLMLKLFHGTPHLNYRQKILATIEADFDDSALKKFSAPYEYSLGQAPSSLRLELKTGRRNGAGDGLKLGQVPHRLLNVLSRDLFKPWSVAALFAELFPERYFNVDTSPATVRNAVVRLQKWFEVSKLPIEIKRIGNFIRLSSSENLSLVYAAVNLAQFAKPAPHSILAMPKPTDSAAIALEPRHYEIRDQLQVSFANRAFTTVQAAQVLSLSRRSCQRYLTALEAAGWLGREGEGKRTRFTLAAATSLARAA